MEVTGEPERSGREFMVQVGERLRIVRKKLGITQKEAAKATGMSQPFLSAVERGAKAVSTAQIIELIKFYRVPYEQIFGFLDDDVRRLPDYSPSLGVELLKQLIGEAECNELAVRAGMCMDICAYAVFRTVYRLNPHNSDRAFSLSYEDSLKAAVSSLKLANDDITSFVVNNDKIKVTSFELPTERNEELRAFIREVERNLSRILDHEKKHSR